jgi:hypothetical protein
LPSAVYIIDLTILTLTLLMAQIGSPYPGGQYPGGQYPGGAGGRGPGIPMPRRSKKTPADPAKTEYLEQLTGFVRTLDAKTLVIVANDARSIEILLVEKTIRPKALKPGDYVEVDAAPDDKGVYTAAEIRRKDPPKGEKAPVMQPPPPKPDEGKAAGGDSAKAQPEPPEQSATIVKEPVRYGEGEAPPKLKRGIPPPRKRTKEEIEIAAAEPPPLSAESETSARAAGASGPSAGTTARSDPAMALLDRARAESANFLSGLPNYVCQQFTTRYTGEGKPVSWRALDVVSSELVYEDGKEKYQKIAINGKPVKGKIEDTGTWSTGEFGTVLADIFSPASAATFKFGGTMTVQRQPATQYDFNVHRENSHWHIGVPGQYVEPAYKGSIWVGKESGRVLRIEMQARQIPKEFPKDTTEMAIDYDWVSLGGQKFLLPVKSEVLSCTRGSSECEKNTIEFRNYRKFVGQSDIIFK